MRRFRRSVEHALTLGLRPAAAISTEYATAARKPDSALHKLDGPWRDGQSGVCERRRKTRWLYARALRRRIRIGATVRRSCESRASARPSRGRGTADGATARGSVASSSRAAVDASTRRRTANRRMGERPLGARRGRSCRGAVHGRRACTWPRRWSSLGSSADAAATGRPALGLRSIKGVAWFSWWSLELRRCSQRRPAPDPVCWFNMRLRHVDVEDEICAVSGGRQHPSPIARLVDRAQMRQDGA